MRRWDRATFQFPEGVSVLAGPNGSGKTSVIEAITMACLGVSPRTRSETEMVRHGAPALWIGLDIDGPLGRQRREIGFAPRQGRRLRRDGVAVRGLGEWRQRGALLVFLPEELRSVKGPPAARRRSLDRLLEAATPGYASALAGYQRAVAQRNALLRRLRAGQAGSAGLRPWEIQLVSKGAAVATARRFAVAELTGGFADWLERLGGGPGGAIRLEPSPASLADVADDDVHDAMAEALEERRERDLAAAQTTFGPHRDDVWVGRGDHDLRRLGSQGEQRRAAMAQLLVHRAHLAQRGALPVMLLDDVLSELDPEGRSALLGALSVSGQALLTTADPSSAEGAERGGATVIRVES